MTAPTYKPHKCVKGGQLIPADKAGGRAGDKVPCPCCGKKVKLRQPFNAASTGYYVQVPMHNSAIDA